MTKNDIFNSKRFIGRKFHDPVVQENLSRYPFKVKQEQDNRVSFEVQHLNRDTNISQEEVASAILEKLKRMAERHLEEDEIKDAVITVPAYFTDAQRKATKDAGRQVHLLGLMPFK